MKKDIILTILIVGLCLCTGCTGMVSNNTAKYESSEAVEAYAEEDSSSCTGSLETEILNLSEVKTHINTLLEQELELVGYDDNELFYYVTEGDLDNTYTYYSYNLSSGTERILYCAENLLMSACNEKYRDSLIIAEVGMDEDEFEIKQISDKGIRVLMRNQCNNYPSVKLVGDFVLISYEYLAGDKHIQQLVTIDLNSYEQTTVAAPEYYLDKDGRCHGTLLQDCDGLEHGFVYEEIFFDDEYMWEDDTGKSRFFYYDFMAGNITPLEISAECKAIRVCGSGNIVVTEDYSNARPLAEAGNLYLLHDNENVIRYPVKNVGVGNFIRDTVQLNESMIAVITNSNIIYIDTVRKKIYRKPCNKIVKKYENTLGYIDSNNYLRVLEVQ